MNAKDLIQVLTVCIEARRPILITGAPGIGKSDIVAQACQLSNVDLIISHPVVSDPTDFKGLPAIVKGQAEFLPFGELDKLIKATKPTVFMLDDLGQSPASVQAACMQLILARQINGHKIADCVTFIAATNRREDRAGVSGMLEPVKSRFASIIQLEVDTDSWIEWALNSGNVPIELIAFIKFRPALLHNFKASSNLKNSPCPRTVTNVGHLMNMGLPLHVEYEMFSGAVGESFAAEFLAFLKIYRSLPNIDTILLNPDSVEVPKEPSVIFAVCGALAKKASGNNIERILKYGKRLPAEFQVMLVRDCIKNDTDCVNTKAYHSWAIENKNVLI